MKEFLEMNNVKVNGIQRTSHPESKYNSFKINISVFDKEKVLNPKFWPFGIKCEMWRAPRPRHNNYDNDYDTHPFNNYTDSDNDDDNESNSAVTNHF